MRYVSYQSKESAIYKGISFVLKGFKLLARKILNKTMRTYFKVQHCFVASNPPRK